MASDDPTDDERIDSATDSGTDETGTSTDDGIGIDLGLGDDSDGNDEDGSDLGARERLEQEADRAISEFDQGLVDLLAWLLDTETRARIYVYLRQEPHSTSEEVADGTGLYPSTVREALAELHEEGTVVRRKREADGAGNNPYEYTAIAPSELVKNAAEQVQSELNAVFNLDSRLGRDASTDETDEVSPVSITVDEESGEVEATQEAADDGSNEAETEEPESAETGTGEAESDENPTQNDSDE